MAQQAHPIRARGLPQRHSIPPQLLPGYRRPAAMRSAPAAREGVRRKTPIRQVRNPLPRRRMTERRVHIMNQCGTFRTLQSNSELMGTMVEDTTGFISREISKKMRWQGPRKGKITLWVPTALFANAIFAKLDEDDVKWTISKNRAVRNVVRLSTTSCRGALSTGTYHSIFGYGNDRKKDIDVHGVEYYSLLSTNDDKLRFRYCLNTGFLTIFYQYRVVRIVGNALVDI